MGKTKETAYFHTSFEVPIILFTFIRVLTKNSVYICNRVIAVSDSNQQVVSEFVFSDHLSSSNRERFYCPHVSSITNILVTLHIYQKY